MLRDIEAFQLLLHGKADQSEQADQLEQDVGHDTRPAERDGYAIGLLQHQMGVALEQPRCPSDRGCRKYPGSPAKWLERVAVGFASPDPQRVIDRRYENLAVANLPGARACGNHIDCLVGDIGCDRDLDPQLGQEVHDILSTAIDLGMALLPAVTLDFGDRHSVYADRGQRLADLVQFERFDNGDNKLHVQAFFSRNFEGRSTLKEMRQSPGAPFTPGPQ